MEYQAHEDVSTVRAELRNGSLKIISKDCPGPHVSISGVPEAFLRVFEYMGTLFVKCVADTYCTVEIIVPRRMREIAMTGERTSVTLENLNLKQLNLSTAESCYMDLVSVKKQCNLNIDRGRLTIRSCDICSLTVQAAQADVDFQGTTLHGYNLMYMQKSKCGGVLKGTLPQYLFVAGNGISPDAVTINEHFLSEFPERKNTQNCSWIYLAGSLKGISRFMVKMPRASFR